MNKLCTLIRNLNTRFGYDVDELLGQRINSVNIATLAGPLEIADSIAAEIERSGIWNGEVYSFKKDGAIFWCYATISTFDHPLFGRTWVLALINITAHKRAEDMLCLTSQCLSLATRTTGIGIWEWISRRAN